MIKGLIIIFMMLIVYSTLSEAAGREKATYVGDGCYVGEGQSVDDAALRQRNNERQERQYDRQQTNERYDRVERHEREFEYEQQDRDWSEY